jgi:hypothetical protein
MSRRKALSESQIRQIRAMYVQNKIGYGTIGRHFGIPASTIRDCINNVAQYHARVKCKT